MADGRRSPVFRNADNEHYVKLMSEAKGDALPLLSFAS
jgi:hypothetical protein